MGRTCRIKNSKPKSTNSQLANLDFVGLTPYGPSREGLGNQSRSFADWFNRNDKRNFRGRICERPLGASQYRDQSPKCYSRPFGFIHFDQRHKCGGSQSMPRRIQRGQLPIQVQVLIKLSGLEVRFTELEIFPSSGVAVRCVKFQPQHRITGTLAMFFCRAISIELDFYFRPSVGTADPFWKNVQPAFPLPPQISLCILIVSN